MIKLNSKDTENNWKLTPSYEALKTFYRLIFQRNANIDRGNYYLAFKISLEINELKYISLENYKKGLLIQEYIVLHKSIGEIKQWYVHNFSYKSNFDIKEFEVENE